MYPVNIVKCIFTPDRDGRWLESSVCCVPAKQYCSANGKNMNEGACCGMKLYVPFGILELLATVFSLLIFVFSNQALNYPVAYLDKSTITQTNVIQQNSNYRPFLGNYDHYVKMKITKDPANKMDVQMEWTLFDKDMLDNWVLPSNGDANYVNSTDAINTATDGSYTGNTDDFIVMSHKCVCVGYYSDDLSTCEAINSTSSTPHYCKPILNSLAFNDIPPSVKDALSQASGPMLKIVSIIALLANFCRTLSIWLHKDQLKKPGTQWMSGFWAAGLCLLAANFSTKMMGNLAKSHSKGYHVVGMEVLGAEEGGAFTTFGSTTHPLILHLTKIRLMAFLGAFCSFMLLFISERAYCTDCTHYAYTEDNIKAIRARKDRRLANGIKTV